MYYNKEHEEKVNNRGDGYTYIGSYKYNEITTEGKNQKGKQVYIRVKCPYCCKEYDVILSHFINKKCKCKRCCNEYKNSFAYYIQQELKEPLNKYWDWNNNTVNPYCINKQSHNIINIKNSKKSTTCHDFYQNRIRKKDIKINPKDSFAQWGIDTFGEDFLEKYWSSKNIVNPWEIKPKSGKKVWILCQEKDYHNDGGGYLITPSHFNNGRRCPYCCNHHGKVHKLDSFGELYPEKAKYWSKNNDKSPYEVTSYSNYKYKFICEKCGKEFKRRLSDLNQNEVGVFCRECNSSKLEQKTKEVLIKYNIKYKTQIKYNGLIGLKSRQLSYDFYLPDYNLLIECQGEQHEKFIEGLHKTHKKFECQLEHDRRKKEYAKKHDLKLLEIWYYDYENIENILLEELKIINKR